MFFWIRWAAAFPLVLIAEAAFVLGVLEAVFDDEFNMVAWLVGFGSLATAFVALAVGYMLRGANETA